MNNLMIASLHRACHALKSCRRAAQREDREQMFLLLTDYFEGVTRERFGDDLGEKEFVILLRDDAGHEGFHDDDAVACGGGRMSVAAFFSGDTIVARECWGEMELPAIVDPARL